MKTSKPFAAAVALAAGLAGACPASAALIRYSFSGVIHNDGGTGHQTFSGELSYDDAAADTYVPPYANSDSIGLYEMSGAPWGMSIAFDGSAVGQYFTQLTVWVGNGSAAGAADQFAATAQSGGGYFGIILEDLAGNLFANDQLVNLSTMGLDDFDGRRLFSMYEPVTQQYGIYQEGRIESFTCEAGCGTDASSVPEPSALALLLPFLAGMGLLRIRSQPR